MRWSVLIGAAVVAGADLAVAAGPDSKTERADTQPVMPTVDVELVIAVDVSASMDLDELDRKSVV